MTDIQKITDVNRKLRDEMSRVIIGKDDMKEILIIALIAGGHVLIEGLPGTAKTKLVRTFAEVIGSEFKRIQFTPDMMPADVTGFYLYSPDGASSSPDATSRSSLRASSRESCLRSIMRASRLLTPCTSTIACGHRARSRVSETEPPWSGMHASCPSGNNGHNIIVPVLPVPTRYSNLFVIYENKLRSAMELPRNIHCELPGY